MLILAFAAFVILVLAWLVAPNGEVAVGPSPATVEPLTIGEPATA
ncbi:MAG: hypothetical protein AVDCRST_MAG19-4568 [uncultured Thermomicrobiales bacterium]|uniref:Uncharacterized protein n=1 Tax=uncultured Thermomicrobiales bacterium TaxID=1645740 RepID=A0A6J4VR57_9BACT|nr:MAG: hypothetical protein AVDCRST_MAG19-4568 [uncultured Thermomicrobiales bacterium]